MVFFYITNVALDVTAGATWWIIKNTSYGVYSTIYYLIYGSDEQSEKENIKLIEYQDLSDEIKSLKEEIISLKDTKI
jgi:hypothetical protein